MTSYIEAAQRTHGICIFPKAIPNQRRRETYGRPYSTGSQRPAESRAGFSSATLTGSPAALVLSRRQHP